MEKSQKYDLKHATNGALLDRLKQLYLTSTNFFFDYQVFGFIEHKANMMYTIFYPSMLISNINKIFVLVGGVFSKTEMSDVLTEICKVEPSFDKERFLKMCEKEIIPNILEVSKIQMM